MADTKSLALRTRQKLSKERFKEVLDRAEKGDRGVLPDVQAILDEFPDVVDDLGDFNRMARHAMLNNMDGGNILVREAEKRKMDNLCTELEGENPTPLESLLAEQIVLSWQHLRCLELQHAQKGSMPLKMGDYYQRSLDRAQRRYLRAVKTLVQIRRLGIPSLQVNIAAAGGRQVNAVCPGQEQCETK